MNINTHVEGYQVSHGRKKSKIEVLCKSGLDLEQFCLQESLQVEKNVRTNFIRPAGRKDVEVTITGLGFNIPDSLVQEYITKFGGVLVTNDVIYERYGTGPFNGKINGVRKYQVDFRNATEPMGTFHLLDGRKLKVFYRGNKSTCGWCHKDMTKCVGQARAKFCKESGAQQVLLADHMQVLWAKIGFSPESFAAPEVDYDDIEIDENLGGDRKILTTSHFPRKLAHPKVAEEDKEKFSTARIKNFPLGVSEDEIVNFLKKEVDERIVVENIKIETTNHSTNILLGPEPNLEVIAKAIEVLDYNNTKKQFFEGRKLHALMYRPLTPEKPNPPNLIETKNEKQTAAIPTNEDGKVKNVVNNLNNKSSKPEPKLKLKPGSHTSLSSAGTSTVARHKEDLRGLKK